MGLFKSTIGAIKVWMDEVSGRLNTDERGKYLGAFDTGDQILAIYNDGTYETVGFELTRRFEVKEKGSDVDIRFVQLVPQ